MLWITLSLHIAKHPQFIQSVKHLWLICLWSTLSHLHCKTPSVISPHEEPLISEFNLQCTDLYLTYSVCTQFTQSALSSLSLHSVFFAEAVRWLTLWSWLLYDEGSIFDHLHRNWKFSFLCSFCRQKLNQIRVSEYVKKALEKGFLKWTSANVCVSCSS